MSPLPEPFIRGLQRRTASSASARKGRREAARGRCRLPRASLADDGPGMGPGLLAQSDFEGARSAGTLGRPPLPEIPTVRPQLRGAREDSDSRILSIFNKQDFPAIPAVSYTPRRSREGRSAVNGMEPRSLSRSLRYCLASQQQRAA